MIQFNLLPDIKAQYIKAQHTKQLVILISILVGVAALAILLIMIVAVDVLQKKAINDANNDVANYSKQLKNIPNLGKILTVQNQLNTLTGLHDQKVVSSRLFTYISQVTPTQITISTLTVDYAANTMSITGEAPSLDLVNAFTDTLKATTYKTDAAGASSTPAFSQVVLSSFGRDSKGATYTVTFTFDPIIFNSANNVTLTVPNSTPSAQQTIFQKQAGS